MPIHDDLDQLLDADGATAVAGEERPEIVVVDDDAGVRAALATLFEDRYQVTVCADAVTGIEAVNEEVHVVILDIKMKGHDGFWACDQIRKKMPGVPVIFYSAYQNLKDPYSVINEHHPFGYVTKDGSVARLIEAVDMAVRVQRIAVTSSKLLRKLRLERAGER